jgi:hypothetical protein
MEFCVASATIESMFTRFSIVADATCDSHHFNDRALKDTAKFILPLRGKKCLLRHGKKLSSQTSRKSRHFY